MQNNEIPTAHLNDSGRPLCNQAGDYPHLCEPDEFERLPKEYRCKRCEQLFVSCRDISDNKQLLLTEISKRTPGDNWCPVADLCKNKTEAVLTSLGRSLRQLEVQGLVEMRTDNYVRLSDKGNSNSYLLDVYKVDC